MQRHFVRLEGWILERQFQHQVDQRLVLQVANAFPLEPVDVLLLLVLPEPVAPPVFSLLPVEPNVELPLFGVVLPLEPVDVLLLLALSEPVPLPIFFLLLTELGVVPLLFSGTARWSLHWFVLEKEGCSTSLLLLLVLQPSSIGGQTQRRILAWKFPESCVELHVHFQH